MRNHAVAFPPILQCCMETASILPNYFEKFRPRGIFRDSLLLTYLPVDELAI
jgi:hypothetical protein